MIQKALVVVVVLAIIGFAGKLYSVEAVAAAGSPLNDPLTLAFQATAQDRAAHAAWIHAQTATLGKYGKEANGAGFSLLRPVSDSFFLDPSISSNQSQSTRFAYWTATRAYTDVDYIPIALPGCAPFEWPETYVSMQRLFENNALSIARVVAETSGGLYRVEIEFSTHGVQTLDSLIGKVDQTDPYADWYGVNRPAGQTQTEMKAVLVSDGNAYLPFSVTNIVGQNASGQPVVVAKNLSHGLASTIVTRLGF